MNFKVRLKFTLVGIPQRSRHEALVMTSKEAHDCMLEQVKFHFGENRPVYMSNRVSRAADNPTYPKCYAAGWFWRITNSGDNTTIPNEKYDSELVVICHGDNFKDANKNLVNAVSNIEWDEFARVV